MRGTVPTEYIEFNQKVPILVRLPDEERQSLSTLDLLTVDDIPVEQIKESVDKGLGGLGGLQGLVNGMGGGRNKMILPLVNPPPRVKEGHSKE